MMSFLVLVFLPVLQNSWLNKPVFFGQLISHVLASGLLLLLFIALQRLSGYLITQFLHLQLTKVIKVLAKRKTRLVNEDFNKRQNCPYQLIFLLLVFNPDNLVYLYRFSTNLPILDAIWQKFIHWDYWQTSVYFLLILLLLAILYLLIGSLLVDLAIFNNIKNNWQLFLQKQLPVGLSGQFGIKPVFSFLLLATVLIFANNIFLQNQQWQEPVVAWQAISLALPADIQANKIYAQTLADNGQLAESRTIYLSVLQDRPNDLEALVAVGSLFLQEQREAEAIHYFAKALRLRADYWPARHGLEQIWQNKK